VALDHPEAFGHASVNCGRGRRAHNRRAVTCHLQRSPVSALSETPDWARLRARSHAEGRPRLRLEGRATNTGNVACDPSFRRRWRTDDFASGSTPVACLGRRVRPLTRRRSCDGGSQTRAHISARLTEARFGASPTDIGADAGASSTQIARTRRASRGAVMGKSCKRSVVESGGVFGSAIHSLTG
jgi:hypothetical protein